MSASQPNFIYLGAPKAASTWLFEVLREHPQVFLPPGKELQYFDKYYERGADWYLRQFATAPPHSVTGDISPEYFIHVDSARRICAHNSDVRLIACLREPIDNMVSWYYQLQSLGATGGLSLDEYMLKEGSFARVEYDRLLQPYFSLFPREQILIVFYDELLQSPGQFLDKILVHIGLTPGFTSDKMGQVIWGARSARSELLNGFAYRVGQLLRLAGFARLVGQVSLHPLFQRFVYRNIQKQRPLPTTIEMLESRRRSSLTQLSTVIGQNLPGPWFGK